MSVEFIYASLHFTNWRQLHLLLLSLISSERMVDDAISIAMATKENLTGQRNMFKGVTSKMQNITRILSTCRAPNACLACSIDHSHLRHGPCAVLMAANEHWLTSRVVGCCAALSCAAAVHMYVCGNTGVCAGSWRHRPQ